MQLKIPAWWVLISACGGSQPVHKGVVWTGGGEADGRRSPAPVSDGAPREQEPYVAHLRCNDGSLAPDCAPAVLHGDCCVNQGGVYRDAWGNLVFE